MVSSMTKLFSYNIRANLLILNFIFSFPVAAEMYKWDDENGDTHYSQSPPNSDVNVKIIKPPSTVDTEGANKTLQEQKEKYDKLRNDRLAVVDEQKKSEEETLANQEKCEQARKRLASYQRPRVNTKNPDGSLSSLRRAGGHTSF